MIGPAAGERGIRVGRQVEPAGRAISLGQLKQQLAAARGIEPVGEIVHLPGPGRVALRPLDEHLHLSPPRGQAAQFFDVLARQIRQPPPRVAAGREADAREHVARAVRFGCFDPRTVAARSYRAAACASAWSSRRGGSAQSASVAPSRGANWPVANPHIAAPAARQHAIDFFHLPRIQADVGRQVGILVRIGGRSQRLATNCWTIDAHGSRCGFVDECVTTTSGRHIRSSRTR